MTTPRTPPDSGFTVDPENVPAGLKRNEMTRSAKQDHLARLGITGARAKEILDDLYGAE